MQLFIEETYEDMSRRAADLIAAQLIVDPASTLGLATGSTPIGLYADLVEDFQADRISFEQVTTVNLDEYRRPVPRSNDQSYRYFMHQNLFDHVNIDPEATPTSPTAPMPDAQAECESVRAGHPAKPAASTCSCWVMGHNGHIGFNEPCDEFPVRTHVVELTESTINANSRLFESIDQVPCEAYTMGIGTIMKARAILVVASGVDKAQIVRDAFFGPVTPQVPASVLQLHPNVTVVVDAEAGSLL